ncbi:unnamed protein product [Danaus chrysippus]|uniref:(African queen) hypothetical protein n=1 Tax=Danaus chrysippus TaxID=151541 RepID=A0A8J2QD01_9NEOP|nr:unnamed protein product [Danaus chrysippus]
MGRQRPTARHFHNQPELRRGCSGMLRWIFLVWLAGCSPRGNTVRQDAGAGAPAVTGVPYNSYQKKGLLFPADPLTAINVVF